MERRRLVMGQIRQIEDARLERLKQTPKAGPAASYRHPATQTRVVVLGAGKPKPTVAAEWRPALTAPACARQLVDRMGRDEETGCQIKQRTLRLQKMDKLLGEPP
jgi:hypothetical protein